MRKKLLASEMILALLLVLTAIVLTLAERLQRVSPSPPRVVCHEVAEMPPRSDGFDVAPEAWGDCLEAADSTWFCLTDDRITAYDLHGNVLASGPVSECPALARQIESSDQHTIVIPAPAPPTDQPLPKRPDRRI